MIKHITFTSQYFYCYTRYTCMFFFSFRTEKNSVSGWRVEAGSTRKYVLMKNLNPPPFQPEFGPWGLNSTRLNPFFHPKNGFNPKNWVGFGRTSTYFMATVRNMACIAFRPEALDVHGLLCLESENLIIKNVEIFKKSEFI